MSAKTLHHIAAADLPQIIVKCMLTFSIVVVTHGVTRGLNAATVSFIEQQRALCFWKAVELFYHDSYYAWMCLLKMSHN